MLNEVFSGGLGSYAIFLTVLSYLQARGGADMGTWQGKIMYADGKEEMDESKEFVILFSDP